ncbi:MAG: glycosyltransferase family 2 protein [Bacteroidota bacterium]|nr:glycosyltransferase family 2 protein [Bacteroidota bacterium]
MHDSFELSIVIVTWNSESEIAECLKSITENTKRLNYEIIIVDNNSSDKTLDAIQNIADNKFQTIKVIINKENTGFTKACNQGILSSNGKNILLLNPDTKIANDSLKVLWDKLVATDKTGAVAPQLLNDDGSIQKSCRTFPTYFDMFCELTLLSYIFPKSKIFSRWKMNYFDHNKESTVDQPMAAALMIKGKVLKEINNFDERYLMFFNDVDLCKKIYDRGHEIIFYPEAKVIHKKGVSIYKDRKRMIRVWNEDCLSYFKKYYNNFILYNWLLVSLKLSGFFRILIYKLQK